MLVVKTIIYKEYKNPIYLQVFSSPNLHVESRDNSSSKSKLETYYKDEKETSTS